MNQKFTPPQSQRQKPREEYLNHPKFMEMFGGMMVDVQTPKDKIPAEMGEWLKLAMGDMAFPALNIPFLIYEELCMSNCDEMTFGVLQKAADIIFSSRPNAYHISHPIEHLRRVRSMATLLDAMQAITNPIRDKVIDQLIASDKIIK